MCDPGTSIRVLVRRSGNNHRCRSTLGTYGFVVRMAEYIALGEICNGLANVERAFMINTVFASSDWCTCFGEYIILNAFI